MSSQQLLYQSFISSFAPKNPDDSNDSYFDDAKHGLLKDLVDFHNREDFDSYMRTIEKNYYQRVNMPQPPYEQMPDFPPKPNQSHQKKHDQSRKDFIDKYQEVSAKRQTAYQFPTPEQLQFKQKQEYYQSINNSHRYAGTTPFFETLHQGKENPQAFSKAAIQAPYMQKFVAGPTRLEGNPLSAPCRAWQPQSPNKLLPQLSDYDLKNPDVQYERYKHLMTNQFYNPHVNSQSVGGFNMTEPHTVYHPPAPFTYKEPKMMQPMHHDMYHMSFNPNIAGQKPMMNQGHIYPQTQQIYHRIPDSVTLYNQPGGPPPGFVDPKVYRSIKENNLVEKEIIESIGGIEDTIKPLQDTLKEHELRPYSIQRDYRKDYLSSQKGKELKRSYTDVKPESMKLVSVSPYRAVVKIEKGKQKQLEGGESSDEEEFEHQQQQLDMTSSALQLNHRKPSPIRSDSQSLRGQREQFLNTFNEKRTSHVNQNESFDKTNGSQQHQRIKNESEYLRQQRENFLNSFSQPNLHHQNR